MGSGDQEVDILGTVNQPAQCETVALNGQLVSLIITFHSYNCHLRNKPINMRNKPIKLLQR